MGGSFLEAPVDWVVGSVRRFEPTTLSDGPPDDGVDNAVLGATLGTTLQTGLNP